MAQVLVQNRVSLALPVIPDLVQNEGINVKKMSPNTMMIVNLVSPDKRYDDIFLSNYATIYIRDELGRLPGVAGITYLGQRDYSLRAWLDPDKLAALRLSATDVVTAISQQNMQVAAGQIGQQPVPQGPAVSAHHQHAGPAHRPGAICRHHHQGRRRASRRDTQSSTRQRRRRRFAERSPSASTDGGGTERAGPRLRLPASFGCATWSRARATASRTSNWARSSTTSPARSTASRRSPCRSISCPAPTPSTRPPACTHKMEELKTRFPDGLDYEIVYDTTPFIRESVNEVFYTLRDAVILVAIVVLLFLQDWRAMILPMIDVPVSLIGTFAVMAAMGFTLNNLTLFGLVLAIGIVVDDAIVVLENIERQMATGLDARSATIKAMDEITGPILAITLVLSAVFIPCCFLGGVTGHFFRQFAVTIAVSTIISAINAMTMTPSRAAMIFKTEEGADGHKLQKEALPWWFFGILGGVLTIWLGDKFFAARFFPPANPAAEHAGSTPWEAQALFFIPGAIVGGIVGWFIISPVNAALRVFFGWFNKFFDAVVAVYGRIVGGLLRISVLALARVRRLAGADLLAIQPRADGLHPAARQGLPDPQRATARFRVGRAHPSRRQSDRADRARHAGRRAHGRHHRPVADPERQRPESGLDVRHAEELRPAA